MYGPLLEALGLGHTVVTGNNRLARTLRKTYDRQQAAAGAIAWASPRLLSWGAWQRHLWDESRLAAGSATTGVCLSDAATAFLWHKAVEAHEGGTSNLPVAQLARSARRAWGVLVDWQAVAAEEWTAAGLSPDQQAFLRWSNEFRRLCDEHAVVDPEQVVVGLLVDAENGLFDAAGPLHFAGCDDLPPLRTELLASLGRRGVEITLHPATTQQVAIEGCPFDSAEAEILAAARWARKEYAASPDAAIAVIVPDLATRAAAIRRTFYDVFSPDWRLHNVTAGLPLNLSYGYPLADAPIVHTALQILELLDGDCDFDAFSLVLRSPWLRGGRSEAALRALVEIDLRDELPPEFPLQDALWRCQRGAPQFAASLEILIAHAAESGRHDAGSWAHWFTNVLQAIGWPAKEELDSESWQTLQAWNEALGIFAASGQVLGSMSRPMARRALSRLLQERLFQPEGSGEGVQVMGILEAAGHGFDKLWVCGMARELWPPAGKPNPFIPLDLQRRLSLPDSSAAVTLDYNAALTTRFLASSKMSIVSWPAQLDGEALVPSPLVGEFKPFADDSDADPLWNELQLESISAEKLCDDPPPPWETGRVVRGGVSVLNRQAISPLNAFIERRLGATEINRPVVGINAMQRGNITHRALELFYAATPTRTQAAALGDTERRAVIRAALEEAVKGLPGIRARFVRNLADREIDIQLERIEEFLALDFVRDDFEVIEREQLHEVCIGPLAFRLKLDRLDALTDGSLVVIDYKTGGVNRQSWNPAAPRDVQLPLYVTAFVPDAAAIAFAQVATVGIAYDGVGHEDVGIRGVRSPGKKQVVQVRYQHPQSGELIESWEELRQEWARVLEVLAAAFAAGDFRLDPRNPDSASGQFAVLSRLYDEGFGVWEGDT
jgi:ATP-dependent helicase/nuclease subunit B